MQAECIQHGLRTLAFCKTRKLCELVTAYTRETLKNTAPHLAKAISVYRAGYSPQVGLSGPSMLSFQEADFVRGILHSHLLPPPPRLPVDSPPRTQHGLHVSFYGFFC